MLHQPKPPDILVSLLELSSDGATTLKLNSTSHHLDTEGSTSEMKETTLDLWSKYQDKQSNVSAIVECLHLNKETISRDKYLLWLTNIPDTELLKTLAPDLTLRGKDFYPFWNSSRLEMYNRLSLPPKTDSPDSDLTSSNGCVQDTKLNSWFSTELMINPQNKNSCKMSYPSSKFLIVNGTEKEDTGSIKCRKIKLQVCSEARKKLLHWGDLYRFCYNRAVFLHTETGERNKEKLRDFVKSNIQQCMSPWLLDLPSEIREGAAFELAKNLKSCATNFKHGNVNNYDIGYKSKKTKSFTLTNIQKRSYKKIRDNCFMFLTSYLPFYFFTRENIPDQIDHDFSIHYDGNDFYLILPMKLEHYNDIFDDRIAVSLDPGVRTFMTFYSEIGDYGKLCLGDSVAELYSLAIFLDKCLRRKADKTLEKTGKGSVRSFKKRMHKIIERTRTRMKNLQREMHVKVSNWLTKNYKVILLPEFRVKEMSNRRLKRKINTKTVRNMSLLAHATFREMLKTKAKERGCQVILVSEHYTSKTCGGCGHRKHNLGGDKIYVCKECNAILDRDVNGARNIMLRAMRGSAISEDEMNQIMRYRSTLMNMICADVDRNGRHNLPVKSVSDCL